MIAINEITFTVIVAQKRILMNVKLSKKNCKKNSFVFTSYKVALIVLEQ